MKPVVSGQLCFTSEISCEKLSNKVSIGCLRWPSAVRQDQQDVRLDHSKSCFLNMLRAAIVLKVYSLLYFIKFANCLSSIKLKKDEQRLLSPQAK